MADKKVTKPVAAVVPVAAAGAPKAEKPEEKKPEVVELKDIAAQLKLSPRECRVILRKINIRGEDQKRARWAFAPADVPTVIARIKKFQEDKAKAAEERAKAELEAAKKTTEASK